MNATYREAVKLSMQRAYSSNPQVCLLGQGVNDANGIFGTTTDISSLDESNRSLDMPIMEEGAMGVALGLSLSGMYPIITHIRADFMLVAMNQIINSISKYRYMYGGMFSCPMLIRAIVGRSWGQGPQHSQSLQAVFSHFPGLTVFMPSSAQNAFDLYATVTRDYLGPIISFEHRLLYDREFEFHPEIVNSHHETSFLCRRGHDLTILATSYMVQEACFVAKVLDERYGISVEIIDLHCISHSGWDVLTDSVSRSRHLLVADTSWAPFGVSAEVSRVLLERMEGSNRVTVRFCCPEFSPCPTAHSLEDHYYPTVTTMLEKIGELLKLEFDTSEIAEFESERRKFRGPF